MVGGSLAKSDWLQLGRRLRREPVWEPREEHRVALGRDDIERLIEHRDPFLLLDGIDAIDELQGALVGWRWIDPADPVLAGHFPHEPIYPGALQIEIVGQLCLCCRHFADARTREVGRDLKPRRYRGIMVHHAAFLRPILPATRVEARARLLDADSLTMTCAGQLFVDGQIAAVVVLEAYVVDG